MRETSIEALSGIQEIKDTHYRKILVSLNLYKSGTSLQISRRTGLDYHAVARRMSELETMQKVEVRSENGVSPSGKRAIIWGIKEKKK